MKKCPFCAEEIQDEALVCKHCGRDLKGGASQVQLVEPKKKTGCAALGCAGILACVVVVLVMQSMRPEPVKLKEDPVAAAARARAEVQAKLKAPDAARDLEVTCSWTRSGFGSVAVANVAIKNKSEQHAYRDVVVEFSFAGESGTTLATHDELFAVIVKPKATSRVKEQNVGFIPQQATRMGCTISRAKF